MKARDVAGNTEEEEETRFSCGALSDQVMLVTYKLVL